MDGLRLKLSDQGLENITYMVVNHQGQEAQRLHPLLQQRLSGNITLYQQDPDQADVWKALDGEKDDFLIYDRCGRLTHHISLPYSILGTNYVEDAIRETYCKRICGDCKHEGSETPAECSRIVEAKPAGEATSAPALGEETPHNHHHHHHHHHPHPHQGHGHHGDRREEEGQGHGHHGDKGEGQGGRASEDGQKQQQQQDSLNVGQEEAGQRAMQKP